MFSLFGKDLLSVLWRKPIDDNAPRQTGLTGKSGDFILLVALTPNAKPHNDEEEALALRKQRNQIRR